MKVIREIEESKSNSNKKTIASRVTMQQEINGETDDKESSTDDESMGSVTHIPKETGVNNSDTESMLTERKKVEVTVTETSRWAPLMRKY